LTTVESKGRRCHIRDMDAWIVAVVTDSPNKGPPIASLFVADSSDRDVVEATIRDRVVPRIHSVEMSSLPPEVAIAFKLKPGEVRELR
jgi:hypothetical protein